MTFNVPGASRKSLHFYYILSCMNTTEMCNTAIEREFCGIFEDDHKNLQKLCNEAYIAFFWQVAESANEPIY